MKPSMFSTRHIGLELWYNRLMNWPRAITFTTDAHFRAWPSFHLLNGEMANGKHGWIWQAGWLKLKLDVYDLESWNALCAQLRNSFQKS